MNVLTRSAIGLAVLAVVFAAIQQPSGPDIAAVRDFDKWRERVAQLDERGKSNTTARVIFLGDSITQMWETEGAEAWARFVEQWGALNFGVSGDCTQHLLWRLQNGRIGQLRPSVTVLMIGSNNVKQGHAPDDIKRGVEVVLAEIHNRLPETKIALMAILPREDVKPWAVRETNDQLRGLADGRRVVWLNCGDDFTHRSGKLVAENFTGRVAVHPSAAGYAILERRIRSVVEPLL